jgi:hypothetical protein
MSGTNSSKAAPAAPVQFARDLTEVPIQALRRRSVWNLLRMGHCTPTVMQTLLTPGRQKRSGSSDSRPDCRAASAIPAPSAAASPRR